MTCAKLVVFLCVLRVSTSDWVSEWMAPIQDQFDDIPEKARRSNDGNLRLYEDEAIMDSTEKVMLNVHVDEKGHTVSGLKLKLENALEKAKTLAEALKNEITELTLKENLLKEAITHGRNGISIISVYTIGQSPREYIIREGIWTHCSGLIQSPTRLNNMPCFGQEMKTAPDHCVFNSVIKYETIPSRRRLQYIEDDYMCLKSNFNTTLEQYMSVPKRVINETCTNGFVRSLEDNVLECGIRVLSEYTYYPNRMYPDPEVPLDYCAEPDGACKLLVAWHVSNATIENFEFLKNEPSFKKYFIKDSQNI